MGLTGLRLIGAVLAATIVLLALWFTLGNWSSGNLHGHNVRIQGGVGSTVSSLPGQDTYVVLQFERSTTETERRALTLATGIELSELIPENAFYALLPSSASASWSVIEARQSQAPRFELYELQPVNKISSELAAAIADPTQTPVHALFDASNVQVDVTWFPETTTETIDNNLASFAPGINVQGIGATSRRLTINSGTLGAFVNALAQMPASKWVEFRPPAAEDDNYPREAVDVSSLPMLPVDAHVAQLEVCQSDASHPDLDGAVDVMVDPQVACRYWHYEDANGNGASELPGDDRIWALIEENSPGARFRCLYAAGGCNGLAQPAADIPRLDLWRVSGRTDLILDVGSEAGAADNGDTHLRIIGQSVVPGDIPTWLSGKKLVAYGSHEHATRVAAIIARRNTNADMRGIAHSGRVNSFGLRDQPLPLDAVINAIAAGPPVSANASFGQYHYRRSNPGAPFYTALSELYDALASGRTATGTPAPFAKQVSLVGSAGNTGAIRDDLNNLLGVRWGAARIANTAKNTISVANLDSSQVNEDSSRGPTADGRIAPLLAAPGTLETPIPDPSAPDIVVSGTSFSTPIITSFATHLSQHFNNTCGTMPAPATVRALLVHAANPIPAPAAPAEVGPDYSQGFGQPDHSMAMSFVELGYLQTGTVSRGYREYRVFLSGITDPKLESQTLRVTLAWDDPPFSRSGALPSQSKGLLRNDLDLEIVSPNGKRYLPWQLDPNNETADAEMPTRSWLLPVLRSDRDHRNTIEQIEVPIEGSQPPGTWRIRIRAGSMDFDAQTFSIVSRALEPGVPCAVLPSIVVEQPLDAPDDWFTWLLFWIAVAVLVLMYFFALAEIWEHYAQPPQDQYKRYLGALLLTLMLAIIFWLAWMWSVNWWLFSALALLIVLAWLL